jgi:hypothetical protein
MFLFFSIHDKVRPHSLTATGERFRQLKFEILPSPPTPTLSPDLAPSDYLMFGPLKGALRERRFASEGEDKDAVQM